MANITKEEIELWREEKLKTKFPSAFRFLNAHKGWREGKLHTILGVSHGGKSTLVRTIIIDALEGKNQVGIILSEESEIDFLIETSDSGFDKFDNLNIYEELSKDFSSASEYMSKVETFIIEYGIKILFLDNITTSFCYMDRKVGEQGIIAKAFKNLAIKYNIPIVIVAHTGAHVTEYYAGLIETNDIRGSKTIVNLSEFFYIMQSFFVGDQRHNTLRIAKHRGQVVMNRMYELYYYSKVKIFGKDELIQFKELKEIYKNRNKL